MIRRSRPDAVDRLSIEALLHSELELRDRVHALEGDTHRWRTVALMSLDKYTALLAAYEDLANRHELLLDEYHHLHRTTAGTIREPHDGLCRRHRQLLVEVEELYALRDELRELRAGSVAAA